jgi:hypothetical protein
MLEMVGRDFSLNAYQDLWLLAVTLFIIFSYFVGFISGFFVRASISHYRRHNASKAREARAARLASAEGDRHNGNERSLIAAVIALVAVSGVIVFDHFKGPLFPDVFYCLNDGGAQSTMMCSGRVPLYDGRESRMLWGSCRYKTSVRGPKKAFRHSPMTPFESSAIYAQKISASSRSEN